MEITPTDAKSGVLLHGFWQMVFGKWFLVDAFTQRLLRNNGAV